MTQPRSPQNTPAAPDSPDDVPMSRRTRERITRRVLKKLAERDPPPGGWLTLEEALARLSPPSGTGSG